ncbi:T9SS type A sorting domain-containing protein [Hymenobacter negativus]|uniref:T9SS type A sorting domain-containing protein n=1 Tax=Hymenobacter negativus TaxID=2795026 RepID=A0ABS0Q9C0_9BACT|nr:T9SS type A sorting domain-containing protein [Hymenobacter negativus]MBH8559265.1 T9SS type A sorting domain-containing protein [Hymenobacter negativus]
MMQTLLGFRLGSFMTGARRCGHIGVVLLAMAGAAQAQTYDVGNSAKKTDFSLKAGESLSIRFNVKYEGTITVDGNNTTITNNGGDITGALIVKSGVLGTVITNLGDVSSQNITLNAPTTINNGSTTVSNATWTGYVGNRFAASGIVINNYANWSSQINDLSSGTINNDGNWTAYFTPTGTTIINNRGNWTASDLNYTGSLTINHFSGSWTANLNPGTALAINNNATWTRGFNFPGTGPNSFVNNAGATATLDRALGMGNNTTITNSGDMTLTQGMGDISANSLLTNSRGATFRVTGQLVNYGTVSNAGVVSTTANFSNMGSGKMTGPAAPYRGSFTTSGYSSNAGAFGVVGRLDFCDSGNAIGFDAQTGSVGGSTTFCSLRPLPVELTSFTAEAENGKVQLRWNTASERNSAKFVVERSATGEGFSAVRDVAAQGNSTTATAYATTDATPLAGLSYYRLRQVDLDGSAEYSPVITVSRKASYESISLYPNPATDRLTLDLTAVAAAPCEVRLLSLTGQLLRHETLTGGQLQEVSLAGIPAGLYVLKVGSAVQRIEKR